MSIFGPARRVSPHSQHAGYPRKTCLTCQRELAEARYETKRWTLEELRALEAEWEPTRVNGDSGVVARAVTARFLDWLGVTHG